jgi:hypothetical protein
MMVRLALAPSRVTTGRPGPASKNTLPRPDTALHRMQSDEIMVAMRDADFERRNVRTDNLSASF